MKKVSIAGVARRERFADARERKRIEKERKRMFAADSFVNFSQKLGIGADNALSTAGYGFNPVTRNRTQLEWIHRGSWLGGVAVDLVADDMTRAGVEIESEISPEDMEAINERIVALGIWNKINETIKWARLYGGALAVMLVDGQRNDTPLRVETVDKGQFKGLVVLDRWMVEPSLSDLVTDDGPSIGLPKFYTVVGDAPALRGQKIHYSRCMRLEGIQLPYWQRVTENLWSISVIERLFDRMVAFDSATTGAAQLVYKAWIRTYKIKDLRQLIAQGNDALNGLVQFVELMRRFQNTEGITLLDAEDEFETHQHGAFSGLSEALLQFGQQLAGALQIPLVRLFGQSPAGLNATGESDIRTYYDGINQQQEKTLRVPLTRIYRMVAQSEGILLPEGFRLGFKSLWQLSDKEKADIAEVTVRTVSAAESSGLISQKTAMQELKQSSHITGIFSNIDDADIEAAEESLPPAGEEAAANALEMASMASENEGDEGDKKDKDKKKKEVKDRQRRAVKDSIQAVSEMKRIHNLDVVIENPKGSLRRGKDWEVAMPADYGYLRRTVGGDNQEVDCYVGPKKDSAQVFIVEQVNPKTKAPDEDKVLLGYPNMATAMADYLVGYSDGLGWERVKSVKAMDMPAFKQWLGSQSA